MKKVTIIGASGFIGSAILQEALSRGYQVQAIARNPERINASSSSLKVVAADVMDTPQLAKMLHDTSDLISAYNPGWGNPNMYEDTLKGYLSIIHAAKQAGVKRVLVVGGAGTLLVAPGTEVMDTGVLPEAIMPGVKSLAKIFKEHLIPEKELDWVFFSPAGTIEPGERTGVFRLGKNDLMVNDKGESRISVEDYAVAMIDELETPKHHQERFTIGY